MLCYNFAGLGWIWYNLREKRKPLAYHGRSRHITTKVCPESLHTFSALNPIAELFPRTEGSRPRNPSGRPTPGTVRPSLSLWCISLPESAARYNSTRIFALPISFQSEFGLLGCREHATSQTRPVLLRPP